MSRFKKRQESENTIDLTPMLDVIFIMLIFFIVTTSFVKESGIEINRPSANTAKTKADGNILIAINQNEEIWIGGRSVDIRALRANVEKIKSEYPNPVVIIQSDIQAKTGVLVEVMDRVREAGVTNISISTSKK